MVVNKVCKHIFKNYPLLFFVFLTHQAEALELKVEPAIYASHPDYFTGEDLFNNKLPIALKESLAKTIKRVSVVRGKSTVYQREFIRHFIWGVIQKYRQDTGEQIRLILPDGLEVFSAYDQLSLDNLKKRIKLFAKSECPQCTIEVSLKEKVDLDYVGLWEVETKNDNWKGSVELGLKTDRLDRVPIDIRWKDDVVVAKNKIPIGQSIEPKDLKMIKKDVTFLSDSYFTKKESLLGRVSLKDFRSNQMINVRGTKKANVIRYGQSVSLLFQNTAFTVTANAKAKGAGAIGDLIPVYIPRTRKKIIGKIIGKGRVRIE